MANVGSESPPRVVVVGGGHNGLTAAHYLADAGLSVTVIERRGIVGGCATTEEFSPGFKTNFASNIAHAFEPKFIKDMALERHGLEWAYPEPTAFFAYPDGRALIGYHDSVKRHEQIRQFSTHDADVYDAVLGEFDRLGAALDIDFFGPPPKLSTMAERAERSSPEVQSLFTQMLFGDVRSFLDEHFESEQVKTVLATLGILTNTSGPSEPGTMLPLMYRALYTASSKVKAKNGFQEHFAASKRVPIGGMGAITQAMRRSLESRGVDILVNCEVQEILCDSTGVRGVRLPETELRADYVVSAINPRTTLLWLLGPDHLDSGLRERVEALDMRGNMFKLMLALDGLPRFAAAVDDDENLMLAGCSFRSMGSVDELEEGYREAQDGHWSSDPLIWGFIPSVYDPRLVPEGKHCMSLSLLHAPNQLANDEGWTVAEKDKFAARVMEKLELIMPGLNDLVIDSVALSPVDLEAEFGLLGGNAAHGDLSPDRMFGNRPLPECSDYRTPVRGLYLSGVGTWPAMLMSGLPGHNSAQAVLNDISSGDPVETWA